MTVDRVQLFWFGHVCAHEVLGAGSNEESAGSTALTPVAAVSSLPAGHRIALTVRGKVPGLDADGFAQAAQGAKENCPVSKALGAVPEITLETSFDG